MEKRNHHRHPSKFSTTKYIFVARKKDFWCFELAVFPSLDLFFRVWWGQKFVLELQKRNHHLHRSKFSTAKYIFLARKKDCQQLTPSLSTSIWKMEWGRLNVDKNYVLFFRGTYILLDLPSPHPIEILHFV